MYVCVCKWKGLLGGPLQHCDGAQHFIPYSSTSARGRSIEQNYTRAHTNTQNTHTHTEPLFFSIPEGPLRNRESWRITGFLEETDGDKLSGLGELAG